VWGLGRAVVCMGGRKPEALHERARRDLVAVEETEPLEPCVHVVLEPHLWVCGCEGVGG